MTSITTKPASIKTVSCPNCKTEVEWSSENSFRPFCSERCQLIDFGEWATEKNSIPVEEPFDNLSFKEETEQ